MRAAALTSSLAQAPVKHILYSSTRDTLSIDPANTKYAISTLSYSETPGRKYTILALHGSEFCGQMGISFKNIQSHSLGVGKLEVTDETIRQPYSSCLPSARRSWDWIHLPRSWSWISHKKRFLNKKLFSKNQPTHSPASHKHQAPHISCRLHLRHSRGKGRGNVHCCRRSRTCWSAHLKFKNQIINSEKVHDRLNESKKEHTKPAFYLERYPGGKINPNFFKQI